MDMAYTGTGAVVGVSAGVTFSARFTRVSSPFTRSVEPLDDTALSSTSFKEFVPDDLADTDEIELEFTEDYTKSLAIGTPCTLTITFPKQPGQAVAALLTGTGFFTRATRSDLEPGVRLKSNAAFKFDGKTVKPTFTVAQ